MRTILVGEGADQPRRFAQDREADLFILMLGNPFVVLEKIATVPSGCSSLIAQREFWASAQNLEFALLEW